MIVTCTCGGLMKEDKRTSYVNNKITVNMSCVCGNKALVLINGKHQEVYINNSDGVMIRYFSQKERVDE